MTNADWNAAYRALDILARKGNKPNLIKMTEQLRRLEVQPIVNHLINRMRNDIGNHHVNPLNIDG